MHNNANPNSKINRTRAIIIFPYLHSLNDIKIGGVKFRDSYHHFSNESKRNREELIRIISFFRQSESQPLNSFSYAFIKTDQPKLDLIISSIRRGLEILRFLIFDPQRRSLNYEHTIPYLIIPDSKNPFTFKETKKAYMYKAYENLGKVDRYLSYYEKGVNNKPAFNLSVHADSIPFIETHTYKRLLKTIDERGLRSLPWYNKTYSNKISEQDEDLLRISTAFETLLQTDKKQGFELTLASLKKELNESKVKHLTSVQEKIVKGYLFPKVTEQLKNKILAYTGSELISKWFKNNFYTTGSTIRHGGEVSLIPQPRTGTKSSKNSTWYGEGATHDFLNNIYFGKKLFRFIFLEKHFPSTHLMKKFEIDLLEASLVSDEERLKMLEKNLSAAKIGDIKWNDLRICFDLGSNYCGEKIRIYKLLVRLLKELRKTFPKTWRSIETHGDLIANSNLNLEILNNYKEFNPYFSSIIEIDRGLQNKDTKYMSEGDFKLFYIKTYISFAVNKLI